MMLREYFNNTIEKTYLKAILSAVQLPKWKIVKDGSLVFKDYYYIYKGKIIQCTETGYLEEDGTSNAVGVVQVGDLVEKKKATYDEVGHYYFCDMDQNNETKEFIRASYYSTELHKRFGQYLRAIRDLYDIDLMGMYNCFSYELFSDLYIDYDPKAKRNRIFVGTDKTKKIFAIPIKFNQNYSIALTSDRPIYISPVLKMPNGYRSLEQLDDGNYTADTLGVRLLDSMQFDSPIQISVNLNEDQGEFYKYEKYLYLIVQLPSDNESSFVMLEGTYKNYNDFTIVGMSDSISDPQTPVIYRPKLLEMNDGCQYAYSNTIMQYLLHNVITNRDIIGENISYAKNLLYFEDDVNYWNNNVRYAAFSQYLLQLKHQKDADSYQVQNLIKLRGDCNDVTGFIDKQIEEWLNARYTNSD